MVARLFDKLDQASEALEYLKVVQRGRRGAIKILNEAVLVKDADGKITLKGTGDLDANKGVCLVRSTGRASAKLKEKRNVKLGSHHIRQRGRSQQGARSA